MPFEPLFPNSFTDKNPHHAYDEGYLRCYDLCILDRALKMPGEVKHQLSLNTFINKEFGFLDDDDGKYNRWMLTPKIDDSRWQRVDMDPPPEENAVLLVFNDRPIFSKQVLINPGIHIGRFGRDAFDFRVMVNLIGDSSVTNSQSSRKWLPIKGGIDRWIFLLRP